MDQATVEMVAAALDELDARSGGPRCEIGAWVRGKYGAKAEKKATKAAKSAKGGQ